MTNKPEFYKFKYAFRTSWTETEAVRLLLGRNPLFKPENALELEKAKAVRNSFNNALKTKNVISIVKLVPFPRIANTQTLYRARDIVNWAISQSDFKPDKTFIDIHDWAFGKLFNPTKRGAYNSYFYQACAIALWQKHGDLSKSETAKILFQFSDELRREFKIDFKKVRPFTIKGYLDDINNDRRPGRPPKRELPSIPLTEMLEILGTK